VLAAPTSLKLDEGRGEVMVMVPQKRRLFSWTGPPSSLGPGCKEGVVASPLAARASRKEAPARHCGCRHNSVCTYCQRLRRKQGWARRSKVDFQCAGSQSKGPGVFVAIRGCAREGWHVAGEGTRHDSDATRCHTVTVTPAGPHVVGCRMPQL